MICENRRKIDHKISWRVREQRHTAHIANFDDDSEWRTTKSQPCAPDSRNQSISEQAQVRYKMKNCNKKWLESKFCIATNHFCSQKSGHHHPELWVFPVENEWFRIFTRSRSTMCLWGPVHRLRGPVLPIHTNSSGFNTTFLKAKGGSRGGLRLYQGVGFQSELHRTSVLLGKMSVSCV